MQHSMLCSRISPICLVSHQAPFRYAFLKRFASFRFSHRQPFRVFFHRMSDFQSYHRRHHLGYHLRKYRYTARCTWHLLPQKKKFVYTLPPVIANIIIVPLVLRYGYGLTTIYKGVDISLLFNAVTVGIGEIISICVLGSLLKGILSKYRNVIFKQDEA